VQTAVETKHHLIVTHEVTNVGSDRAQLVKMAEAAREALARRNSLRSLIVATTAASNSKPARTQE